MARRARQERRPDRPRREMPWGDLPRGAHEAIDGLILIDKPAGVTSHDIVGAMRRLGATRKVGHTGTLDPMATGLLTVAFGRATKLVQYLTGADKTYEAGFRLGIATDSHDADGELIEPGTAQTAALRNVTPESVDCVIADLTGQISQIPPAVSAKKIGGKRAHDLVRDGQAVDLAAQTMTVHSFDRTSDIRETSVRIGERDVPAIEFDAVVSVSSGTYVRALARDLGEALGVGAHLTMLRRTRIGAWNVADASRIETLRDKVAAAQELPILSIDEVCRATFSAITITDDEAGLLARGLFIERRDPVRVDGAAKWPACAFLPDGTAVAVVSPRSGKLKPDLQIRI